jgi:lipoate-protein ligase A
MGLDEALLESDQAPPTVRMYSWSPDTLSLGYFQTFADVPAVERAGAVVRRITGGGAIHHKGELTFSITAPLTDPVYRGPVAESYRRVHAAVARALAEFGVEAELCGDRKLESDDLATGMCFHASTPLDLTWDARKGVGSAQRRKGGRVLHHGSIKLTTSELEGDIAFVDRAGTDLRPDQFAGALRSAFEQSFGVTLEAGVPDVEERTRARELGARYLDPKFLERR